MGKAVKSSAGACKVDDRMWGLDEGVSDGKVKTSDSHAQFFIRQGRWCWWQRAPKIPRGSPGSSPSFRGWSFDRVSEWSSVHSAATRASPKSHRSVHEGRGLWVKVSLPIFKDEKTKDAVTYCSWGVGLGYVLLLGLGWQAFAALHISIITRVMGWPSQEFRQRHHPEQSPPDVGWVLWCHNDVWHPQWGVLFPQARIRGECGWIQGVLVTAGPDTPVRVPSKDSARVYGGDEVGWLLWGP